MSEPGKSVGTVQPHNSYLLVLFVLPISVLTFFAATLFAGVVGNQATEIAKLIVEIESSCLTSGIFAAMGPLDATNTDANLRMCHSYFPKVVGFYVLAAVWCVGSFFATAHIGQGLKSQRLRYWWSAIVAVSIPAIILAKYWVAGRHETYVTINWEPFEFIIEKVPVFSLILVVLLGILVLLLAWQFKARRGQTYNGTVIVMFWFSIVAFVTISILFAYLPGNPYDFVGSINIIIAFVLLAYLFMTGLFFYSQKTGWPVAGMFLLYFMGVNVVGSAENVIGPPPNQSARSPASQEANVLDWLEGRKDFDAYPGDDKKYPIYIIASSGGGMYAAMRTAYYLETLQKHCPRFLHHTFAISGVSGGAIGALAFAAGQQISPSDINAPCNFDSWATDNSDIVNETQQDHLRTAVDKFFASDVVSSIVGGGLFPGLLRRLFPLPLPDKFDRASAFRLVLSDSWRQAVPEKLRNQKVGDTSCTIASYFSSCRLDQYWTADGNFPVMVFNATWVDIGLPTVISNLPVKYVSGSGPYETMSNTLGVISGLRLIDGASISSRFPIALPAGVLNNLESWRNIRLVDGGYFDNSGLMAAKAIADRIETELASKGLQKRVEVQLIYLGENYTVDWLEIHNKFGRYEVMDLSTSKPVPKKPRSRTVLSIDQWFSSGSDLGAHGETLFKARDQRSLEVVRLLRESTNRHLVAEAQKLDKLIDFEWKYDERGLVGTCGRIPLAWYLAPCSRRMLEIRLADSLFEQEESLKTLRRQLSP